MRKIVFIAANEYVPWGGSEYLWAGAAEKLVRRDEDVCVSVKDWGRPVKQIEQLRAAGCRIFKRAAPSFVRRAVCKPFPRYEYHRRYVDKVCPAADLVVVSQGANADGLRWMEALRSGGYNYAVIAEGAANLWWPEDEIVERLAVAYEGASAAYFVSEDTLELCRRQFVTPLMRGKTIRNPFNVPYNACPAWPGSREELSLAFVSRLEIAGKGHDVLLQVLSLPHWRERDIHVYLYGDGPNQRALPRMVEQERLTSVHFSGFVKNIEEIWERHHALILPSRHEGMPLTLVEAMLCGRPAIITDVGGVRELLRDNINGFLVKAPTVELLDEALSRAWENRHRLKEMGEQAAVDVRKFVGPDPVEDFVRELLSLIESPVQAAESAPQAALRVSQIVTKEGRS